MTVIGTAEVYIVGKDQFTSALKRDATQAGKDVGDKVEHGAGRGRAALKAMGGSLRTAFGPALGPFNEIFDKMEGIGDASEAMHGKVGKALLGVGGAAAVTGGALQIWGDKDKIAQQQLRQAVEQTGGSWEKYHEETEKLITSGEKYGHTAEETQTTLKNMTLRTNDAKGSFESMGLVTNLAAARHMSLASAGDVVAKIMNGNTRIMKQYGISQEELVKATTTVAQKHLEERKAMDVARIAALQDTIATTKNKTEKAKAHEALRLYKEDLKKTNTELKDSVDKHAQSRKALEILANRMQGQASIAANTFSGHLANIKAKTEDVVAQVGQKLGPALTAGGPILMAFGAAAELGIGDKLKKAGGAIKDFNVLQKASGALTKIWTGIQLAFNLVMDANPIMLIVIAVGLLIAGFVLAYIKIKPFHDLINAIGKTIGTFFVAAWHKAIDAFHWFVNAFEAVWKFVADIIKRYGLIILTILVPFLGIPLLIAKNWGKIVGFFKDVWDKTKAAVVTGIAAVVGFFQQVGGKIATALGKLWSWVSSHFSELFTSIRTFVAGRINNEISFWRALPGRLATALGSIWSALSGKFWDMSGSIHNFLMTLISNAASWISGLPGRLAGGLSGLASAVGGAIRTGLSGAKTAVLNAFTNAGSWLVGIGQQIISGLASSIGSAVGTTLKSVVSGIAGKIKSWKGPPSYDATLLHDTGGLIVGGLIGGLEGSMPRLQASLGRITNVIGSTGGSISASVGANGGLASGRTVNLFPNSVVSIGDSGDAQMIVKRLETLVAGSRL